MEQRSAPPARYRPPERRAETSGWSGTRRRPGVRVV